MTDKNRVKIHPHPDPLPQGRGRRVFLRGAQPLLNSLCPLMKKRGLDACPPFRPEVEGIKN